MKGLMCSELSPVEANGSDPQATQGLPEFP